MLFKSLLEYNNDSIISIDSIGRVTYANPQRMKYLDTGMRN